MCWCQASAMCRVQVALTMLSGICRYVYVRFGWSARAEIWPKVGRANGISVSFRSFAGVIIWLWSTIGLQRMIIYEVSLSWSSSLPLPTSGHWLRLSQALVPGGWLGTGLFVMAPSWRREHHVLTAKNLLICAILPNILNKKLTSRSSLSHCMIFLVRC